jgi:hypothetical protein
MVSKVLGDGKGAGFPDLSTEGTWTKNGDRYTFTFKGPAKEEARDGTLQDNGRLTIPLLDQKLTLVFVRAS